MPLDDVLAIARQIADARGIIHRDLKPANVKVRSDGTGQGAGLRCVLFEMLTVRRAFEGEEVSDTLAAVLRAEPPFFQVHDRWLIRQLAPDIAKIEMPHERDKRLALAPDLLQLMGRETANIHLGSRTGADLADRLRILDQNSGWFPAATDRMVACTRKDHAKWAERYRE